MVLNIITCKNIKKNDDIEIFAKYDQHSVWKRKYFKDTKHIKYEGVFIHDTIRNGLFRAYNINGTIAYEYSYINGKLEGIIREFYDIEESKYLKYEGVIHNEKKIGPWKYYYPNGMLEAYEIYDSTSNLIYRYHFDDIGKIIH
jgi:antitoxin component YwqK of YwqJK toxin-antitoxin module